MNGDTTERLSQESQCPNAEEYGLLARASAFAGGVLSSIQALAGTTTCKGAHIARLKDWDIEQEKNFQYKGLSDDEKIEHIAKFISGIWQIHAFREGNTRTTAIFTIQYLRSLGYKVNNEMFAKHSWYFRNALVRANYRNILKDIDYSPIYLVRFFRNLLLGENWVLKNRCLHIHFIEEQKA